MNFPIKNNILPLVRLEKVKKTFQRIDVLKGLDLILNSGEALAILGPNGSGKSTLIKVISGLLPPDQGLVQLFGKTLKHLDRDQRYQIFKDLGIAFQHGGLFDSMDIRENIFFALKNMTAYSVQEMESLVRKFLLKVNLNHVVGKKPNQLSGGMRRRVCVVRALITQPRLVLLDEPTAGLDPINSTMVIQTIHKLTQEVKSSFICVTSSVDVAFRMCKHVALLRDGALVASGTWDMLNGLNDPWIQSFLNARGSFQGMPQFAST